MIRLPCLPAAAALALSLACRSALGVAFSEIMYHPDGGEEYEYIELVNEGAAPEVLTGAAFTRGIAYAFTNAASTVLNPGDYLVIAKDRAAFQSRYPAVTNLAPGAFTGKLDDSGEKITLSVGGTAVSVTYGTTNGWPVAADGYGPSLERFCLTAAPDNSANWSASLAPTDWQQVAWTGQLASANLPLTFFLDFDGKCLLDEVSVKALGSEVELVTNGSFEDGLSGWSVTNSHSQSRVEAGQGWGGGAALALQCNESRWYLDKAPYSVKFYGDAFSNRVASAPLPVVPGQSYVVSWRAKRAGLGQTLFSVIGGVTNALPLGLAGTPGRANTVSAGALPLGITNVAQTLSLCPVGATNVVRAKLAPAAEVGSVAVYYQVIGTNQYRYTRGAYASVAMRDDGVSPDTAAGDGTYAVNMPAVSSNMSLVRYHVLATATNGFVARSPRQDDPSADYGYWVQSSSPQTNLPNWHLLMDGAVLYPYSRHLCAVSPDGQVFTDILAKHRGNEDGSNLDHSGIGLHFHRERKYNAWFARSQDRINIRHRFNNLNYFYRRVVCEPLAYDLQRTIGLATPRLRYICSWINGYPTITTELEAPESAFLTGNGISTSDYVSRQSYSEGRETVAGDVLLDNFASVRAGLDALTSATRNEFVRTNLCYESIQHSLALLSLTGNGDQHIDWNMMQHRAAADGRWRQYPWDTDISFDSTFWKDWTQLTNLHPYYKTPLHPSIWSTNSAAPLGRALFYPEGSDPTTLPYRYRQQMTLWRYCSTLYTTNVLFPKLNAMLATLTPAYRQISPYYYSGNSLTALSNQVNSVKDFILKRRSYLLNGAWSDKMSDVWSTTNSYKTSSVAISEIMHTPYSGGKYIELFNRAPYAVDLSRWFLRSGYYAATLPFGSMIGPTSYVVLAGAQATLTNAYVELADPARMAERYTATGIWDWPVAFTSATEYASRVIQLPGLDAPSFGATIELRDMGSNLVDRVTYGNLPPWPDGIGVALERINPYATNTAAAAWRTSTLVGTPGGLNTATSDTDLDQLPDAWEQRIIAASGGLYTALAQIQAADDFDGDGLSNGDEFVLGTDPVTLDPQLAALLISVSGGTVWVGMPTLALAGSDYAFYSSRLYTLQSRTNLLSGSWSAVPDYTGLPAGGTVVYTNAVAHPFEAFRFTAELLPLRP